MTNALIEELQAGPGSRELSDKVLRALAVPLGRWLNKDYERKGDKFTVRLSDDRPDPSRNLQDAVDLVPEGRSWVAGTFIGGQPYAATPAPYERGYTIAPTPALALCLAIIKARSL